MAWLDSARYADELQQIVAWIVTALLLACAIFVGRSWAGDARVRRLLLGVLVIATLVGAWASFYQSRSHAWVHSWDLFHTLIGAKYYDELGYSHLYDCAYLFSERGDDTRSKRITKIRDLRTLRIRKVRHFLDDQTCATRFSSARRAEFLSDVRAFNDIGLDRRWHALFRDKGYNGTPFYTFLAASVVSHVPIAERAFVAVASIDLGLLLVAAFVVARTRGLLTGLLWLALLSVCFPGRYEHMGGSFLRFDYVAMTVIGLCALERGRAATAGVLLAYATLVRAFPVLYAGAVGLAFLAHAISARALPRDAVRFAWGFGGGLAVLLGVAALAGYGLSDWNAWIAEVSTHTKHSASFRVGFKHLFMFDGNLTGREGFVGFSEKTALFEPRRPYYLAACAALLLPVLLRSTRMSVASFASLFGTLAFFVFMIATRYYYAVLVIPLLASPEALGKRVSLLFAALLFGASAVSYSVARSIPFDAFAYNTWTPATLALIATALALLCAYQTYQAYRDRTRVRSASSA